MAQLTPEAAALVVSANQPAAAALGESTQWFSITATVPIKGINAAVAQEKLASLCANLSANDGSQPAHFNFTDELTHRLSTRSSTDRSEWRVELDRSPTSPMGLFRAARVGQEVGVVQAVPEYKVALRVNSTIASDAVNAYIKQNPELTVGELEKSAVYALANDYAVRNARRIAALIGASLTERPVSAVMSAVPDLATASSMTDPYAGSYMLAKPDNLTMTNFIETRADSQIRSAHLNSGVLFHRGTAAPRTCVVQSLSNTAGFVVRQSGDRPMPVSASILRESPEMNSSYQKLKEALGGATGLKEYTRSTFASIGGEMLSSRSAALYGVEATYKPQPGDVHLIPVAVAVAPQ